MSSVKAYISTISPKFAYASSHYFYPVLTHSRELSDFSTFINIMLSRKLDCAKTQCWGSQHLFSNLIIRVISWMYWSFLNCFIVIYCLAFKSYAFLRELYSFCILSAIVIIIFIFIIHNIAGVILWFLIFFPLFFVQYRLSSYCSL